MKKSTLVLGASEKTDRYSNMAIRKLISKKHKVFAVGVKKGKVLDVIIETEKVNFKEIDTVTLYLNPERQREYYSYILDLKPKRVIFNPGTENVELVELLQKNKIETEIACTLVLLSIDVY